MLKPGLDYQHLDPATSPELMKPLLQGELSNAWSRDVRIGEFFVPRVLPGKNGRLLVQYRFSTIEEDSKRKSHTFFGQLLAPTESAIDHTPTPALMVLPSLRLLIPVFPFDRKLKALPMLFNKKLPRDLMDDLGSNIGSAEIEDAELLGYRPERRAVLRLRIRQQGKSSRVVAKLARPDKAAKVFAGLRRMESAGFHAQADDRITVPRPIAHSLRGIVWLENVPDPSLHELVESGRFASGCEAAAQTLNKLHNVAPDGLPHYGVEDERTLLRGVISRLSEIYPQASEQLEAVFSRVEGAALACGAEKAVTIHRDFYDKQLLVGPKRITLLDVDTLAQGDSALDVGNFLAHLRLRASQTPAFASAIAAGRRAFIRAYRATESRLFWHRVEWWESAALLRLVCVYMLRPRWQHIAMSMLESLELSQTTSTP